MLPAALLAQIHSQPLHGADDREVRDAARAFWAYVAECARHAQAIRDAFAAEQAAALTAPVIPLAPDDALQAQLAAVDAIAAALDAEAGR